MGFNILNLKLKLETWVLRLPLTARLYGTITLNDLNDSIENARITN
jgi:hypothetical protein